MAASLLLMSSDRNKAMKPAPALCANSSDQQQPPPRSGRGRKAGNNGKGPNQKKQPQRGMGVAQLEDILRAQEMNQMHRSSPSSSSAITPYLSPFSSANLPLHHAASTNHGPLHFPPPPPPPPPLMLNGHALIHGGSGQAPIVANNAAFNVLPAGGGGYSYGFGAPAWSTTPLVGRPVETSRELSSIPNPHSESQPCDLCFKKKRFTDDNILRGSNTRRDSTTALDIWSMINGPAGHFLGFPPQQEAPNHLPVETTDFTTRMSSHNPYSHRNLDESVGVVAVHRKVGSTSGKILMEYEFFPGKENARITTTSREVELCSVGGEAAAASSSSISPISAALSARARYADPTTAAAASSNCVDLSLKL